MDQWNVRARDNANEQEETDCADEVEARDVYAQWLSLYSRNVTVALVHNGVEIERDKGTGTKERHEAITWKIRGLKGDSR